MHAAVAAGGVAGRRVRIDHPHRYEDCTEDRVEDAIAIAGDVAHHEVLCRAAPVAVAVVVAFAAAVVSEG
jgi:hypothetical protein